MWDRRDYCRKGTATSTLRPVVAHTSEIGMPASRDTNERRQAIWPQVLMPIVVLLVALALYCFKDEAQKKAAGAQTHSAAAADPSGTTEP
jgi:hypothetical protein